MTTIDYLARIAEADLDDMVEKIVRAYDESRTPSDLRERFAAFAREQRSQVERLDATLLGAMAWWLIKGGEEGHAPDVLEQVALQSAQRAVSVIARGMKQRQGQPFDPARVAIVAYAVAEAIAGVADFRADLKGATEAIDAHDRSFSGEVVRLRKLIEDIADTDFGDVEMEHRFIIDRCRAEMARWDEEEAA